MTLKDFLESATDGINFYIGAEDGGGFFFIGKPSDALNTLDEISQNKLDAIKKSVKTAKDYIKFLKSSNEGRAKSLLVKKKQNLKNLQDKIKAWTPLFDREVISIEEKVSEPGFNVIVSGYCEGKCWFIGDFDKSKAIPKNKDIDPEGLDNLRAAIIIKAANDYKDSIEYERQHGTELKEQYKSKADLEKFFRSGWFESLCDLDGEEVMYMVNRKVIEEELDAKNKQEEFEAACQ